jgi:4-hydroxyphenylpyruvate dioxygenase-like putative hemolysin
MQVTVNRKQLAHNALRRRADNMRREIDAFIDACEGMDVDEVAYAIVDLRDAFDRFRKAGIDLVKEANV